MKVAVVGDIGIDLYKNLKIIKPGGIAFNFAYNLKQNKKDKISLVSILGNDIYSKKLKILTKKLKLNSDYVQTIQGFAPLQNIFLKNGERKFIGYSSGVLKKWKLRNKDISFIKMQDVVFVPLSDGMEHIFNIVKKIKGPVKAVDFSQDYEFADFDKKENVITKNAKYFDVIFIGGKKKHLKLVQSLSNKYPEKVFVLTLSKDGSIGFFDKTTISQPACKIKRNQIIDTTGCGDSYQSNFLSTWLLSKNLLISLKAGAKAAKLTTGHIGSTKISLNDKLVKLILKHG